MKRVVFLLLFIFAANAVAALAASPDKLWQEIDDAALQDRQVERLIIPREYRTFTLNKTALRNLLSKAPVEFTNDAAQSFLVMTLPMPDGTFSRFRVEESPIFEPALAAQYPDIKTYRGQGIDDPAATARFDLTPQGFHSMILSPSGTILVDPYAAGDTRNYISYHKNNVTREGEFICAVGGDNAEVSFFDMAPMFAEGVNVISGTILRTYRLALAATGEYTTAAGGGTVAGAMAAMTTAMNRVNGVYERDLAIRMVMVANNNLIVYTDPATDPYTNSNGSTMLGQNQTNIDSVIGTLNYDIGHVFSTGGGGVAVLQSPCRTGSKARGVTGQPNPVGDPFYIDYVAHEMGHQFGGNHTFNGGVGSCAGGNRAGSAAYEPGSGVTIMAYAGICGNQNLARNSIDTFHVKSIEEIVAFTQGATSAGNVCDAETSTGNTAPAVMTTTTAFNIPKQTPFSLTATATDVNGDSLTYDWQEYDLGPQTSTVPNSDADGIARPIFRPYLPSPNGTRFFPSLRFILNNANVPPPTTAVPGSGTFLTGELLPNIARTMNFQVIVRDNRAGGGGVNTGTSQVIVDGNSGPFNVTAPNTNVSVGGNGFYNVTWNVANTTNAPVSAANVRISLSTDGGLTFPTEIVASTPNDGAENVVIPNMQTTQARIKIEAVGNIFFDISNADFMITAPTAATATISGQVLSATNKPLSRASVTITGSNGFTKTATTNRGGFYQITDVPAGANYTFNIRIKGHTFNPTTVFIDGNLSNFNFTATP